MNDLRKTKAQLAAELAQLRHRVSELEVAAAARQHAEAALLDSETALRALLNAVTDSIMLIERDGTVVAVNETTAARLNTRTADMLGRNVFDFLPANVAAHRRAYLEQVLTSGQPVRFEDERSGRWIDNSIYPVMDDQGRVGRLAIYGHDMTARKLSEEALSRALAKYQILFDTFPMGITMSDRTGQIVEANRMAATLLGVSYAEHTRRSIDAAAWRIVRRDGTPMPPDEFASVRALKEDRVVGNVEMGIIKDPDDITWLSVTAAPLPLSDGGVVITYGDITARVQAESQREAALAALRQSEANLRAIFENSLQSFLLLDRDRRVQALNRVAVERTRAIYQQDLQVGDSIYQLLPPAVQANFEQLFERVLAGEAIQLERSFSLDGHPHWYEYQVAPVRADHEQVTGIFMSITDATARKQAEAALRAGRDYLQAVLDAANDAFFVDDADTGTIIDVNQRMCELYGYTRAEALRIPIGDLSSGEPPYSQAEALTWLTQAREVGPQTFEWRAKRKDGSQFWAEVSIRFALFGEAARFVVTARDITDRKQAELALQASENKYRALVQHMQVGVVAHGPDTRILFSNPMASQLLGLTPDQMRGKTAIDPAWSFVRADGTRLPPDEYPVNQALGAGTPITNLLLGIIRPDRATPLWVQCDAHQVREPSGVLQQVIVTFFDITDRRLAEDALRESEERFRLAFDTSPDAVNINRLADGQYVDINTGFTALTGYTREDTIGRRSLDINIWHDPADRQKLVHCLQTAGYCDNLEAQFRRKDGSLTTALMSARVITLLGVPHILSITRDISERKRAEEALRASEEKYRLVVEHAFEAIYVVQQGLIVFANPEMQRLSGQSEAELLGRSMLDFLPADKQAHALDHHHRLTRGEITADHQEYQVLLPGGRERWIDVHAVRILWQEQPATLNFASDITERKLAEQTERQARQLAEALRDTATALTSSLELEAVLDRILNNVERVVPHDGANIMLITGSVAQVVRTRGRCRVESISAERHAITDTYNLSSMLATGEPCIIDRTHDNPQWRTLSGYEWIASYAGVPIFAAEHELLGYLGLYSSQPGFFSSEHTQRLRIFAAQAALAIQNAQLHARIQLYAEQLEERVRERTRQLTEANAQLAELDQLKDAFLSRVSHELRTPLTNIKIYLELLAVGKPEKRAKYMQVLNEQTTLLHKLIESLLEVTLNIDSGLGLDLRPTDLNHEVMALLANAESRAVERGLTLSCALVPDLPPALADPFLLKQALTNLVTNALSYTSAGGTVELRTAAVIEQAETWLIFAVRDTGPGITPQDLPHIFERFYRGRAAADYKTPGAGVGLSISREIMARLNGRLTVESAPGAGATFTAWLRPA